MRVLRSSAFLAVAAAGVAVSLAAPPTAVAQSNSSKAANCSTYARNRAESESSAGRGAIGGAAKGAAGGALFGAIIDGGDGAGKGAALGAGLGLLGGSVRAKREREDRYRFYYDQCMQGRT